MTFFTRFILSLQKVMPSLVPLAVLAVVLGGSLLVPALTHADFNNGFNIDLCTSCTITIPNDAVPPEIQAIPDSAPTPPVSNVDIYIGAPATQSAGGSLQVHTTVVADLWYAWNRWLNGQDGTAGQNPTSDSTVSGYVKGLENPDITVSYDVAVTDASGNAIPQSGTVTAGQTVKFVFKPLLDHNIAWFGTGYSMDSPYGHWQAGAAAPARVANKTTCVADDFVVSSSVYGWSFGVYIPFQVAPPTLSLNANAGITSCNPSYPGDGSTVYTCTVTGSGALTPTFNFSSTYGYFYYRYTDSRNGTSGGTTLDLRPGCYGNNIPLAAIGSLGNYTYGENPAAAPGYQVVIPATSYVWNLSVAASVNNPPTAPTITGPASGTVGTSYSYAFQATDPDSDGIAYMIDWDNNGVADASAPASGTVPSGTTQSSTHTWNSAGTYTFQARTQDSNGAYSGWTSKTVTVSALVAADGTASANPSSIVSGSSSVITYSCSNATSGSWSPNIGAVNADGGSYTISVSPTVTTAYTLTCTGSGGTDPTPAVANVNVITLPELTAGSVTPTTATAGSDFSFSATVTNTGGSSTGSAYQNLFQLDFNADHSYIDAVRVGMGGPTGAGGSSVVTASPASLVAGTWYVRACADTSASFVGTIDESDETNNCGPWTAVTVTDAPSPDLTAGTVTPSSATAGQLTTFSATITNGGNASTPVGGFNNVLQFDSNSDHSTVDSTVVAATSNTLSQNGSVIVTNNTSLPTVGTWYARACADNSLSFTGSVTESDENNNCSAWTTVTVSAPPAPDLTAGTVTPTTATAGTAQTYSVTVSNGGTASTGSVYNNLFQFDSDSNHATVDSTQTVPAGPTTAGGNATVTSSSFTFFVAGTAYVRLCADNSASFTGTITETDEGNNCGAWTAITVSAPAAPVATLSASPTTVNAGSATTLTYRCTNSTSGTIDNGVGAITADGASRTISASPASSLTYTLTCTGPGGTNAATAAVTVTQPDVTAGLPTPTSATAGTPVLLSATVSNGTAAPISTSFPNIIQVSGGSIYPTANIASLAGNGSAGISATVTFGSTGAFLVRACADNNSSFVGTITEGNEGNNCSAWQTVNVVAAGQPNLTASAPTPVVAVNGQAVTISSTISNTGSVTTGAAFTDLFQRATDSAGTGATDIGTYANATLGASPATNVATLSTSFTTGVWYVRACADKQSAAGTGVITESSEGDNCSAWTRVDVYPVLTTTCSVLPASGVTGQNVTWTAYPSGGTGTYTYSWSGSAPLAGNTANPATVVYSSTGTMTGAVTVTSGSQTTASTACSTNADNNVTTTDTPTTNITPAQADLSAGSVTPITATAGSAQTYTVTVTNTGTASTGAAYNNLFQFDSNADHTVVDATQVISAGPTGASGTTNVTSGTYTFAGAGTAYVRVCADQNASFVGTVTESNEANNCGAWTSITVSASPQPNLTTGTVSPTTAIQGTPQSYSATVTNAGTASTGASFTNLLQKADDASGTNSVDAGTVVIGPLAQGGSGTATISYSFPAGDAGTTRYLRVCADKASAAGTGTITESNETDNCGAWTAVTVGDQCSAQSGDVAVAGTNSGSVWGSSPYTSDSNIGKAAVHAGLISIGQNATIHKTSAGYVSSFSASTANGITTSAYASPWCGVTLSLVSIDGPDLTTGAVTPTTVAANSAQNFTAAISNGGNQSTGASFTSLLQKATDASGTGSTDVGTVTVTTIAAGGNGSAVINYTFPSGDGGTTKYLRVCADKASAAGTGTIAETNEVNNCGAWTAVTVSAPALPDLSAGSVTTNPVTVVTGSATSLSALISNATAATGAGFTDLFEVNQTNNPASFAAIYAKVAYNSAALAAPGSNTATGSYTFPSAGTWYVRACADTDVSNNGSITEGNEGNNCGAWQAVTVSLPSGGGQSVTCSPSPFTANPGDSVTWTPSATGFSGTPTYTWTDSFGTAISGTTGAQYVNKYTAGQAGNSYVVNVTAVNGGETAGPTSCSPVAITGTGNTCSEGPVSSITSTQTQVVSGGSTVISWSATGISPSGGTCSVVGRRADGTTIYNQNTTTSDSSCNIVNGSSNQTTVTNITSQTTFTITCTGAPVQRVRINVTPNFVEF